MDNEVIVELLKILLTAAVTIVASNGFWMYMMKKQDKAREDNDKRCISDRLLLGIAHDRIVYLALKYIDRGNITPDEYENLFEFLFKPYVEMGGNGGAKRLMDEVRILPIVNHIDLVKKG